MENTDTIYHQLGKREAIAAVVARFYERVLADPRLNHYFDSVELHELRAHQTAFLSAATGGPDTYTGASMRDAHAHLDLTPADFEAVAVHLQETLYEFDVDPENVGAVMDTVASLRPEILGEEHAAD